VKSNWDITVKFVKDLCQWAHLGRDGRDSIHRKDLKKLNNLLTRSPGIAAHYEVNSAADKQWVQAPRPNFNID
jgi:hypothetical protein